MEDKKILHKYIEGNIEIIIEMPVPDYKRDKECIKEINTIMNNELLLQLNK